MKNGTAPILLEAVKVRLTFRRAGTPAVYLLNHDGRRTEPTISLRDERLEIDGTADRAGYGEVVYR